MQKPKCDNYCYANNALNIIQLLLDSRWCSFERNHHKIILLDKGLQTQDYKKIITWTNFAAINEQNKKNPNKPVAKEFNEEEYKNDAYDGNSCI